MERVAKEMIAMVNELRKDLDQLEKAIHYCQANKALNQKEYQSYKMLIEEYQMSMKEKLHLFITMLRTDSADILNIVKQKNNPYKKEEMFHI